MYIIILKNTEKNLDFFDKIKVSIFKIHFYSQKSGDDDSLNNPNSNNGNGNPNNNPNSNNGNQNNQSPPPAGEDIVPIFDNP